jgi:hypothetical protein
MRTFSALLAIIGVAALALSAGSRIPPDTVAMAAGVVLGALSCIPVSLFMSVLRDRSGPVAPPANEERPRSFVPQPAYSHAASFQRSGHEYPPLVIINPSSYHAGVQEAYRARVESFPLLSGPREFRVVGEEAS